MLVQKMRKRSTPTASTAMAGRLFTKNTLPRVAAPPGAAKRSAMPMVCVRMASGQEMDTLGSRRKHHSQLRLSVPNLNRVVMNSSNSVSTSSRLSCPASRRRFKCRNTSHRMSAVSATLATFHTGFSFSTSIRPGCPAQTSR